MSTINNTHDSSSSNPELQTVSSSNSSSAPQRLWSCLYCGSKFDSKMKLKNHGVEVMK